KGSAITHRGIARLARGADYLRLGPGHRVAQLSNTSFDAATWEIWGAWLSGAALVALPRELLLDPAALAEAVREWRLTTLFLTTAVFNAVAAARPDAFAPLAHLLFGGEAADPAAARRALEGGASRRLLHMYGPSESATYATWHPVTAVDEGAATVPIGRPVAHTSAHVLDEEMRPVADGGSGELYLGGEGLAHGYIGRPALTAERFVPDPFSRHAGDRLYRTGDLVRRNPRGELEFAGRLDGQVKLRGLRVELGEIEAALCRHPAIAQAVVLLREDAPGDRRLAAYAVAHAGAGVDAAEVRDWLKARLPGFMVPAAVVALDAFPLTPNGKVDRRALPAPSLEGRAEGAAPATETERALAAVWAEVLRVERVYADDDFFDLGGQSLLASQVTARVREALGVELPLRALFQAPTLAALAAAVDAARGEGRLSVSRLPVRRAAADAPAPLSHAQRQLWVIERMNPGGAAYVIAHPLRIRGALDVAALERALDALRARHAPLRTTFAERDG
ncbi:MAG TPA: AMP-binding protein, partial [Longimicrobium sp.]|nr:AMP-binding protein [Longimicrobium sp.]